LNISTCWYISWLSLL